jgi:hypothetical protein
VTRHIGRHSTKRVTKAVLIGAVRRLKVYPGFAHGMCTTHKDVINRRPAGVSQGDPSGGRLTSDERRTIDGEAGFSPA